MRIREADTRMPRCPLQVQQPDYHGSRAFSYPLQRLEPERERASWGVAVALFAANISFGRIIAGITQQMDYLERLGIEAIWLSPFYPSPLVDGGYDVADYCDVDPRLGSLDDFDDMVAAAHARGIKVIVDIVPNHSSNQHPWFKAALAAGPGSPERARYIFRDGRGEHGELPPTNWNATLAAPPGRVLRTVSGSCICLRPSSRTLTGHAPRFMRSFATS